MIQTFFVREVGRGSGVLEHSLEIVWMQNDILAANYLFDLIKNV